MSRRSVGLLTLLAALPLSVPRLATARDHEHDFQQWLQVYLDGNLDHWAKGLRLSLDLQSRRMNAPLAYQRDPMTNEIISAAQNPNTLLILRPAIGYQFAKWGNAYVGYAWAPDFFDDPGERPVRNIDEHRIFEQLGFKWSIPALELSARTRLEQRVRDNGPGSAENDAGRPHWAHRWRQQVRMAWTIEPGSPWQLIAYDEVLVHLSQTNYPSRPGFDQNRAFAGLGYDTAGARVEIGYLNQYVHRFTDPDQVNHVLSVNLVIKLGAAGPQPHKAPAD